MSRIDIVEKAIHAAFGNATVTLAGMLKLIHMGHIEIKNVAIVITHDHREFTIWVKYHDRTTDTFSFLRESIN